jgi:hypothetical protein
MFILNAGVLKVPAHQLTPEREALFLHCLLRRLGSSGLPALIGAHCVFTFPGVDCAQNVPA